MKSTCPRRGFIALSMVAELLMVSMLLAVAWASVSMSVSDMDSGKALGSRMALVRKFAELSKNLMWQGRLEAPQMIGSPAGEARSPAYERLFVPLGDV
jgi:hypothetical protein